MKKLAVLATVLSLVLVPNLLWADNPTIIPKVNVIDTMTVDSQHTGTWESAGTLIVTASDTADVLLTVTGLLYLGPGEALYVGFADSAAGRPNLGDSLIFRPDAATRNPIYAPFVFQDVVRKNGTVTDTFYVYIASGSATTKLKLDALVFSSLVCYDEN